MLVVTIIALRITGRALRITKIKPMSNLIERQNKENHLPRLVAKLHYSFIIQRSLSNGATNQN